MLSIRGTHDRTAAMPKVHTHYDNLKVTRNAPPEVIRAAYKSLSQKFHPDRNPGDPNATRTFQIINTAYEVLSDPLKRREHDDWIQASEAEVAPQEASLQPPPGFTSQGAAGATATHARSAENWRSSYWQHSVRRLRPGTVLRHASGYLFLTAVATLVLLGIMFG
jgi:curved DNA-binding protein CbpA